MWAAGFVFVCHVVIEGWRTEVCRIVCRREGMRVSDGERSEVGTARLRREVAMRSGIDFCAPFVNTSLVGD